jgi:uncharacterized Tic20 family protein
MSIAINAAECGPAQCQPARTPSVRLRQGNVTDSDRNYAVITHLSPLGAFLFGPAIFLPLILWLVRKDQSAFNDDHGRESVNAVLSFVIYNIAAMVTIIGLVALPVLYVIGIINLIRGAVAAGRGEYFRYPMTIRFLS